LKKVKRTYIHCDELEEAPMWGNIKPKDQDVYAERSADLMREPDSFKIACQAVLVKWPNSSMQNLSARCLNRMAWIGHAANFLSHDSVEYTTRLGWRMLDKEEQEIANKVANEVIEEWEQCQRLD
jgi:hypothetical protein